MDAYFSRISATYDRLYDTLYDDYNKGIAAAVLLLLLSAGVLGLSYVSTGETVSKGIDFTGGTAVQVQVPTDVTTDSVATAFEEQTNASDITVRTMTGAGEGTKWIIIESTASFDADRVEQILNDAGIPYEGEVSIRTLGASVGSAFFQQAVFWSGIALLIMSTVIFVAFRTVVPSLAVIFAALTDILFALAGMSLLGIDLTLGSLAALLMLLGYSVDTDILLSTRVLKQRKQDLKTRIKTSIATGSTMTLAAVAAFTALYVVSPSPVLNQLASVIIIGLLADLPITWLGNAGILKWYVQR